MKFRKKPVEIEAIQFCYTIDGMKELLAFAGDSVGKIQKARCPGAKAEAQIMTREDGDKIKVEHIATEGDWIIKGVKGEFYPCKPDIFEMTYYMVE